jgi:hypothetical protein
MVIYLNFNAPIPTGDQPQIWLYTNNKPNAIYQNGRYYLPSNRLATALKLVYNANEVVRWGSTLYPGVWVVEREMVQLY